jgi:hypothetical protein
MPDTTRSSALVSSWAADNRYYFDAPLHPKAAEDLVTRIEAELAERLDIAVKQKNPDQTESAGLETPGKRRAKIG